jgi:glyoxylase-like metal-dependent hydrolase (beta-lactamase superfamily II)
MVTFTKIEDNIYVLTDEAKCCANLVVGTKRALLFDTCTGADDMLQAVRSITDLPILVIASHGHFDHIGGSIYFDEVYMREEEYMLFSEYSNEIVTGWIKDLCNLAPEDPYTYDCRNWEQFKHLDFDSFDLGELECQVIPLPGHTIGSVGIYIPSKKVLLSGDALTPVMCMNFTNHGPLDMEYETLQMVLQMDIEYYLTSHHNYKMGKEEIRRMIECIEQCKGKRFHEYQYPTPPYTMGWFRLHSVEGEPVGIILAHDAPEVGKKVHG